MKTKTVENVKTYGAKSFRDKFLGEENPIHLLFNSNSDHFFCLEIEDVMRLQYTVPPSKHSCHTMIFVTSGGHKMKLGYEEHLTIANEIMVVPAGHIFSISEIDMKQTGYICQFHPDILIGKYGSRDMINEFDFLKISGNPKIKLSPEDVPAVTNVLERLKLEFLTRESVNLNIVQAYLIALFYEMNKKNVKTTKSISAAEVLTGRFKELIHANIKTQHQVTFYASQMNITPNHLNKAVKTVTGKSATKWIDETILLEAKYLLFQTTLSVSEIAMQVGHEDHSYFSRFFKKHEGISPVQYRKMIDKS